MRAKKRTRAVALSSVLALAAGCGGASGGADGDEYYSGKTVKMVISTAPGGGTDAQARFLAPWLNKCIPGNPKVVPENIDGGGGVTGLNRFFLKEAKDGTTIAVGGIGPNLNYVFGEPNVEYDFSEMTPLVGAGTGAVIYGATDAGVESVEDLFNVQEPLVMGQFGSPIGSPLPQLLALEFLGLSDDVNSVFGYEGTGPARLAFMQGETTLNSDTTTTITEEVIPQAVETGDAVLLFSLGVVEDGDIVADPDFPDLPTVKDVYQDQVGGKPSGPAWEAYVASMAAGYSLQKIWWTHASAPEEAQDALREGIDCILGDDQFQAEAEDAAIFDKGLVAGDELQAGIDAMLSMEESAKEWTLDWARQEHGLDW